jgi:ABC-type lipoprotein export system ATPase subunit
MKASIVVSSDVKRSARVVQMEGIFDVAPSKRSECRWEVELPIEARDWNIGLIVGPSGCGKSTIARKLWPAELAAHYGWPSDQSILDAFPEPMSVKDIIELLSSVGFSSPPSWVRPFAVLSNGEQFRVALARVLAESPELAVVDEFTSVVDRTVAQVGSAALAKTVRRRGQKFVAVTCHEDVTEWLEPDWIYRPAEQTFGWRSLQRRPPIELAIQRTTAAAWRIFKHHHYLTSSINPTATCFVAFWRGRPVAFDAWLPFVGKLKDDRKARRGHRTVCLPDYQGVGIGNALFSYCASLWAGMGYRAFSCTGHPAEMRHRARSKEWKMTRRPSQTGRDGGRLRASLASSRASYRMTASFEYVGQALERAEALRTLNTWALEC